MSIFSRLLGKKQEENPEVESRIESPSRAKERYDHLFERYLNEAREKRRLKYNAKWWKKRKSRLRMEKRGRSINRAK